MSRSRKKPIVTDYGRSKRFYKRIASKTVRKYKGVIPDGKAYRKLYCSWNICDYKWFLEKPHENDEMYEWSNHWYEWAKRK